MELINVRITNFRSVEDSGGFSVEPITCLVGKNEAGKTGVLQAIGALNPHTSTPLVLDRVRDYPRRFLTEYEKRHAEKDAIAITTTWKLADNEIKLIEAEFGPGVVTNRDIQIVRRYDAEGIEWNVSIDYQKAVNKLIGDAVLSAPEKSQIGAPTNSQQLRDAIIRIENQTEKHKKLLTRLDALSGKSIRGQIEHILSKHLPKFMYFSNYDRMSGLVRLDILKQELADKTLFSNPSKSGDRLFYEFLQYAGIEIDDILKAATYEPFTAKLQAASNRITDQILEYWSQNPHLEVRVTVDAAKPGDAPPFNTGVVARARIYNTLHRVDGPFSERSAGFIWFFSFLIKFAQVEDKIPIVLLLDEPGLTLHGKAQADLLRFFDEKLAPSHQLIYSTHSPFMVASDRLLSARIVEDRVITSDSGRPTTEGTKVREDVLNRDPDTIFPLQGALGYEITQSLFIGKQTLLVEGPSDILYLQALSAALRNRGRTCLDVRWTICPSGGIGKIMPFVTLFKGNSLNIAVLCDYVKGDKKKIEALKAAEILKAGAVLTAAEFSGKEEADIEDLLAPELFVEILNEAYQLTGKHKLTIAKLDAADTSTPRLVKKAEAYFNLLPSSFPVFDHFTPSLWLIRNPSVLEKDSPEVLETLDRAAATFEALNLLVE